MAKKNAKQVAIERTVPYGALKKGDEFFRFSPVASGVCPPLIKATEAWARYKNGSDWVAMCIGDQVGITW